MKNTYISRTLKKMVVSLISNREKEFDFGKNVEEFTKFKDCLIKLSKKYGLGEIFFEKENCNQLNCFFIKAPKILARRKSKKNMEKSRK